MEIWSISKLVSSLPAINSIVSALKSKTSSFSGGSILNQSFFLVSHNL